MVQLVPKSFSELGFTKRGHLQEWIAKMPESHGEALLIIQRLLTVLIKPALNLVIPSYPSS